MDDEELTRQKAKNGGRKSAVLGALIALAAGLMPAITLGSTAALVLLAQVTGSPAAPGWMVRTAAAGGAFIGLATVLAIGIVTGLLSGSALAVLIDLVQRSSDRMRLRDRRRPVLSELPRGRMAAETEADLCAMLEFLGDLRTSLHSLVVVGSAAHDALCPGSDYDIVLIGKEHAIVSLQDAVAGVVLAGTHSPRGRAAEFTLLRPSEAVRLFRLASPFAFAMRCGAVMHDDGFLRDLAQRTLPCPPGRAYYREALYENILVPYYGSFRALQQDANRNHCTPACCRERTMCAGLMPVDTPARAILRMLYVTLPARGYMPLTKQEVIAYARSTYGAAGSAVVQKAAELSRPDGGPLRYADLVRLKRFAGARFREILVLVGITPALRSLLADGAHMVQGRYGLVRDRMLRHCVAAGAAPGPDRDH